MPTKLPFDDRLTHDPAQSPTVAAAAKTWSGQAHFAGTGPRGAKCYQCVEWKPETAKVGGTEIADTAWRIGNGLLKPAPCDKYARMMNKQGPAVPHDAAACRHFIKNENAPAPRREKPKAPDAS